jgi:hypothetical protein
MELQNVRIARILGWIEDHSGWWKLPATETHPTQWMLAIEGHDWANDAAFILGMIEQNGLSVYRSVVNGWVRWFSTRPDGGRAEDGPYGEGANVRDSVLAWIEAAHAAGVEVKR